MPDTLDTLAFELWEVLGNKDQTEGKSGYVTKRRFIDEQAAVAWAKSDNGQRECGVMGHGYGKVVHIAYWQSTTAQSVLTVTQTDVWGYRKPSWKDKWDHGFFDERDKPDQHPEFAEYMRLKTQFEGTT